MKYREKIVRVEHLADEHGRGPTEAKINEKNKPPRYTFIGSRVIDDLAGDKVGYFTAEKIGEVYFIGERQRGGWSW